MDCDRSHHTVAFCFRINVTYEVELVVATDLPEVERRGRLALEVDPVVPCRCMVAGDLCESRDDAVWGGLGGMYEDR